MTMHLSSMGPRVDAQASESAQRGTAWKLTVKTGRGSASGDKAALVISSLQALAPDRTKVVVALTWTDNRAIGQIDEH